MKKEDFKVEVWEKVLGSGEKSYHVKIIETRLVKNNRWWGKKKIEIVWGLRPLYKCKKTGVYTFSGGWNYEETEIYRMDRGCHLVFKSKEKAIKAAEETLQEYIDSNYRVSTISYTKVYP